MDDQRTIDELRTDIDDMAETISQLEMQLAAAKNREQLFELMVHLDQSMKDWQAKEVSDCDAATEWWASLEWQITFNGKTHTVVNCAAIYNGVYDAVKEMLFD